MAQGIIKKPSTSKLTTNPKSRAAKPTSASNHASSSGITKKGGRNIAPRNKRLQKQAKITKKLTSGLTAQTERMLGEKAGHLEMIGKGRDKKGEGKGVGAKKGKR